MVSQHQARGLPETIAVTEPFQLQKPELTATTAVSGLGHESSGPSGRVLAAYRSGLEIMEKTGVTLRPHTTLRELLTSMPSLPPATSKLFLELTAMAEIALYSAREVDEELAVKAEHASAAIKHAQIGSQGN